MTGWREVAPNKKGGSCEPPFCVIYVFRVPYDFNTQYGSVFEDDGATGFDFVDVDLLALPQCLDEAESFWYDPDYGREPHLTLAGKKGKREVVIEIYFEPFEDEEASTIFDVNFGTWRHKQSDED